MSSTPNTPANGGKILTWQERTEATIGDHRSVIRGLSERQYMQDEIADLRASLAAPAIPTVDRNSVLTLKDLAAQFCESAASGASLTISADSAALLFAAMTTPPAAPAKLEDAKFIAEAAKAGIFCTMPQAVAFGRMVESAVFGAAQPAAQVAVSGMHEAADFIDRRAQKYIDENADTEFDTGVVVFHEGAAGRDYHSTLVELADDLRATPATVKTAEGL